VRTRPRQLRSLRHRRRLPNLHFYHGLSAHTHNLQTTGLASVLLIEDEAEAPQVFARQRIAYDCQAALLPRGTDAWGDRRRSL
jgi:putative heme iron utilization protein